MQNHAKAIAACDFVVPVTLHFRILYVFVLVEVGSRKLIHVNATPHPIFIMNLAATPRRDSQ